MALRGSLADTAPEDLLQILAMGGKTGVLSVTDGERRAELVFDRGRVIDAFDGLARGLEVVTSILGLRSGAFAFAARQVPTERTIECDMSSLLLAGAHQLDNLRQAQAALDRPPARPRAVEGATPDPTALTETDRAVLALADGTRSLSEIAAASGLRPEQVYLSLGRLLDAGAVAVADAGADAGPLRREFEEPTAEAPSRSAQFGGDSGQATSAELREIIAHLRNSQGRVDLDGSRPK